MNFILGRRKKCRDPVGGRVVGSNNRVEKSCDCHKFYCYILRRPREGEHSAQNDLNCGALTLGDYLKGDGGQISIR